MPPDFVYELNPGGMFLFVAAITGAVAIAVHRILAAPPVSASLARFAGVSPIMQTLCGTLFVLSVTFLANSVWQTENRAREIVSEEARSLRILGTYMNSMTGPSNNAFAKLIEDYSASVAAEWPHMAAKGAAPEAEAALAGIYRAVILGFGEGDVNRMLQQRMLAALDTLSLARAQRISMAREIVSFGQWFTVFSLGLLLLLVIAICHAQSPASRAAALSIIALAISISLFVIIAHDRPFVGRLAITPDSIVDAAVPRT